MSTATAPETKPEPGAPPDDPKLFHHDYDGIREIDNPAPAWLTRTFYACIVFAIGYFAFYHVAHKGTTIQEDFDADYAVYSKARAAARANEQVAVTEDALKQLASQADTVEKGHQVFVKTCAGCHTDNGRGLVGPNLTDDYQIHGKTRMDVYHTAKEGVLDKGMPAWGEVLSADDLLAAVAYVTTLRGTNVAGGKAPQGDKVGPFE